MHFMRRRTGGPMGSLIRWLSRNKLVLALIVGVVGFQLAPLWINRAEPRAGSPQNKCDKHITDPCNDPKLVARPNDSIKVIRLTNSGEFADRCELTNALYELNWDRPRPPKTYGPDIRPGAQSRPKLVLLYIHGWKHNGDVSDPDRIQFKKLIDTLRDRYQEKKYVVGIYIGWNAEAGLWGWLENLTFWVKKNNADRIAQSSSVTLIVSSIGAIVHADPNKQDQFVAIGHSFGARLLFSATAQSLVTATERAHPGYPGGAYKVVRGLTDAVILLNPAFEASRYSAINDFARNDESFSENQPPLIVTISSEADHATKDFFPIGQWLGLARTDRELQTLGNYDPYQTHTLNPSKEEDCTGTAGMVETYFRDGLCLRRLEPLPAERKADNERGTLRALNCVDEQCSCRLRLKKPIHVENGKSSGVVQRFNPFVVARTTQAVIRDHNDIWNDLFSLWLVDLILSLEKRHSMTSDVNSCEASQ
jgi:pimeloyl-ACP methyl ester carboxylesterase